MSTPFPNSNLPADCNICHIIFDGLTNSSAVGCQLQRLVGSKTQSLLMKPCAGHGKLFSKMIQAADTQEHLKETLERTELGFWAQCGVPSSFRLSGPSVNVIQSIALVRSSTRTSVLVVGRFQFPLDRLKYS